MACKLLVLLFVITLVNANPFLWGRSHGPVPPNRPHPQPHPHPHPHPYNPHVHLRPSAVHPIRPIGAHVHGRPVLIPSHHHHTLVRESYGY